MAESLEVKRLKTQLKHVDAAKSEQELRIQERLEEIERLKEAIRVQDAKMAELEAKIAEMTRA
jgi:hypothetical protein